MRIQVFFFFILNPVLTSSAFLSLTLTATACSQLTNKRKLAGQTYWTCMIAQQSVCKRKFAVNYIICVFIIPFSMSRCVMCDAEGTNDWKKIRNIFSIVQSEVFRPKGSVVKRQWRGCDDPQRKLSASPLTASRRRLPGSGVGSRPVIFGFGIFFDCKVSESKDQFNSKGTARLGLVCP